MQDSTPGNSNLVHVNIEENILGEKDTNELQVLDDNTNVIEQNNRPKNNSNNEGLIETMRTMINREEKDSAQNDEENEKDIYNSHRRSIYYKNKFFFLYYFNGLY